MLHVCTRPLYGLGNLYTQQLLAPSFNPGSATVCAELSVTQWDFLVIVAILRSYLIQCSFFLVSTATHESDLTSTSRSSWTFKGLTSDMEYNFLSRNCGLKVSAICLGGVHLQKNATDSVSSTPPKPLGSSLKLMESITGQECLNNSFQYKSFSHFPVLDQCQTQQRRQLQDP